MKQHFKTAFSLIEFAFIAFVLFFIYTFVIKQMIGDMKYSKFKRTAATSYTKIQTAAREFNSTTGIANQFDTERSLVLAFAKKMNAEGFCEDAKKQGCWSSNWIWAENKKPGFKLASGEYVLAELTSIQCNSSLNITNTCGTFYIDTNGSAGPNLIGRDMIKIYLTKTGVVPAGIKQDIVNPPRSCDMSKKFSWACTARLLGMK